MGTLSKQQNTFCRSYYRRMAWHSLRGPHFVALPPFLLEQAHIQWLSSHVLLPRPLWKIEAPRRANYATCRAIETSASPVFGIDEVGEDLQTLPTAPKAPNKRRLDEVCLEQYPEHSRSVIQSWIAQGKVAINGRVITKAGTPVASQSAVQITAESPKFVCRAGLKLEGALDHFGLDVSGMRVLDAGLSTGGFTDCLLQRGASHVVGVDVGYGQVAERIRIDPRVTVMERTNLRYVQLEDLPEQRPVDLATLDLSFISLLKVLPSVCGLLTQSAHLLALIKPQFEAGRDEVSKGGIVKDVKIHRKVIEKVTAGFEEAGFVQRGCIESPLKGAVGGNTEFLALFERTSRNVSIA